jgi:hypothetical protein
MNFVGPAYYAANDPWKNLFKSAWPWMREGQRDDQPADFDLDANGYIKRFTDGEAAFTFVGATPTFPAGDYVLLYDGQGSFKFGNRAIAVSTSRGRIVVRVTEPTSSPPGVRITLAATDPKRTGDYVRNIRFMETRFESDYLTDPWHPRFVELWSDYAIVRFVCWQEINYSTVRDWSDNAPRDAMSFYRYKAIPPEWIVEYLNYTGKDGWICIPHLASDDYARTLGRFLREKLRPDLKLVIEYANEFWHPGFACGQWAQNEGGKAGLGQNANENRIFFAVKRAGEVFRAFEQGFGSDQMQRVLRTVGSLGRNAVFTKMILSRPEAGTVIDAVGIAPYIGSEAPAMVRKGEIPKTVDAIFEACRQDIELFRRELPVQAAMCREKGVLLVAYECGPHLTPKGDVALGSTGSDDALIGDLCQKASYDPRMTQVLNDYLDMWRGSGGKMALWFVSTSPYSRHNMMGMLESIYEDPANSPKYLAVRDWMRANPKW